MKKLLTALAILSLGACTQHDINAKSSNDIEITVSYQSQCFNLCDYNGGVSNIKTDMDTRFVQCTCNNGTVSTYYDTLEGIVGNLDDLTAAEDVLNGAIQ